MAGKRIEMKDVHSIVLMLSHGYGTKHIFAALGCTRNTVKAYRAIIASKGLTYEELLSRPEEELERFFISKKPEEDNRMNRLEDAFKNADGELGKVGVTKFLLWNEYRLSNPDLLFSVQPFLRNLSQDNPATKVCRKLPNQLCRFLLNVKLPISAEAKIPLTIVNDLRGRFVSK